MKKITAIMMFMLAIWSMSSQTFVRYSTDSSRIKYATFDESFTQGMTPETFFTTFLQLDPNNWFIASDTIYSPNGAYTYIKYRQLYDEYPVENTMVTLTFHNNHIIRFNGYYVPVSQLLLNRTYTNEDAIGAFKQYYSTTNDSCNYYVTVLVSEDFSTGQAKLCCQVQSSDPVLSDKILYVSSEDLSVVKEGNMPGAGFNNATFYTQYNGVREGYNTYLPWTPPAYILRDTSAAVEIYKLDPNVTNLSGYLGGVPNTYYNDTSIWGYNTSNIYPNYILDAYWSASEYSYYMQNAFGVSKGIFQRYWKNNQYVIDDTITPIIISYNTFVDNTFWSKVGYRYMKKDVPQYMYRNVIVIGTPGPNYLPKASIDETVHEFAHIFSFQNWYHVSQFPFSADDALAEACADIWAAVITSQFYPNDEYKIWKIGEDVVLPSSYNSCIRNIANPSDSHAEIQMKESACQTNNGNPYEQSGVISHWFYLLTHGYNGVGCTGECYSFSAIPIDSAAKLIYCCETMGNFMNGMSYSDICQATLNATENFSNPESIRSSVLGAWNVVGVKPYDVGVEQFGLSYNSSNGGIYVIDNDLVIDSLMTLTVTGTLRMCDTCSIVVRPGGKLVVDGGTLTSACPRSMWHGIEVVGNSSKQQLVQYQGKVELKNGAIIENAYCGIYTGLHVDATYVTTGGMITAKDATFLNNRRAVEINSYSFTSISGNILDYSSSFTNCTFSVNGNNLFSDNNTAFTEHVRLWDVKGVKFHGCTFTNAISGFVDNGRGIYAQDAGLVLDEMCSPDYIVGPNDCECPPLYADTCVFRGFTTAVEVNASNNPYAVTVNRVLFENNVTGLRINGNNYATVTQCDFNLQDVSVLSANNRGLLLIGCTGYKVEANKFRRSTYIPQLLVSTGIQADDNGTSSNNLHLNNFVNQNYGIFAKSCNGNSTNGLGFTCNSFNGCGIDFYVSYGATVAPSIGSSSAGADNNFQNTRTSSLYNAGNQSISYFYSIGSYHVPYNPTNFYVTITRKANSCASTLCNNGPLPFSLSGFQSQMNAYTVALANQTPADGTDGGVNGTLSETVCALSETYYDAVRSLMADTVLDLNELEQWHTVAQPIADPYSLTETRFMMGYNEPFVADADDAELSNYADFHAMKVALRNTVVCDTPQQDGRINWYALTPAQIAQLQTIAERNAGRASVMAKGVLCFFFGICYDEWENAGVFDMPLQDDDTTSTRAKHTAMDTTGDAVLNVYPNPTDDLLYVELSGAGIQSVALYDLQGRVVADVTNTDGHPAATVNVRNVPAGVYVLRVTDETGREYHRKVVVK